MSMQNELPVRERAFYHNKVIVGGFCMIVVVILATTMILYHLKQRHISPVPQSIAQSVDFPIYYPVQSRLPSGFTLDPGSFKQPIPTGINYTVTYGNQATEDLVFSLQPKPSDSALQKFDASYIPLHNSYQTSIGQAYIGAYNTKQVTETLVSLPVDSSDTWIIVTAPYNINQGQLKQVLSSLSKN